MTNALPLSATLARFNELGELAPDDMVRAEQIEWSARAEVSRSSGEVLPRLILAQAFRHQGKAEKAIDEAHKIWALRQRLDVVAAWNFGGVLTGLGLYELALELMQRVEVRDLARLHLAPWIIFNIGDLAGFKARASSAYLKVAQRIEEAGFASCFSEHQAVLRRLLAGRQVYANLQAVPGEDDDATGPSFSQYFYLAASYGERAALEAMIYEALKPIYSARGFDVNEAWDLITPMLMDVRARPPTVAL